MGFFFGPLCMTGWLNKCMNAQTFLINWMSECKNVPLYQVLSLYAVPFLPEICWSFWTFSPLIWTQRWCSLLLCWRCQVLYSYASRPMIGDPLVLLPFFFLPIWSVFIGGIVKHVLTSFVDVHHFLRWSKPKALGGRCVKRPHFLLKTATTSLYLHLFWKGMWRRTIFWKPRLNSVSGISWWGWCLSMSDGLSLHDQRNPFILFLLHNIYFSFFWPPPLLLPEQSSVSFLSFITHSCSE